MMEGVIDESKDVEKKATEAENEASAAYQTFIADSNAAIDAMNRDMTAKKGELAKSDESKAKADGDLKATEADLLALMEYKTGLHTQCDFVTKYFDIRQEKRAEEIEALQQAKAIFSGADFGR